MRIDLPACSLSVLPFLWQQLERARKTWTDPNRPKIPTVSCQDAVDTPPFRNSCNHSVNKTQVELPESSIELQRSHHVERNGRLKIIAGFRVEDLGHEFSHDRPLVSKKVIYLSENERRHDYQTRRSQDLLIPWEARLAVRGTGECPKKSARVCNDWWDQVSRSRNNSASSPSLLSVDSKRAVDGGRRPA